MSETALDFLATQMQHIQDKLTLKYDFNKRQWVAMLYLHNTGVFHGFSESESDALEHLRNEVITFRNRT